ncbi:hypothetical protein NDI54_14160 [Haloarcula sp. S1AR25-5A]|uniref:Uncharacterized protein n=1 Tax=Haloarcula terrestris TaxID=2950533 RepID=A0AAE4JJZ4_9EURY|nr:hypothetical protein [Haloarcula terrestris]MDS0222486.1 hypothetical protein [Haloarcula terrestris]
MHASAEGLDSPPSSDEGTIVKVEAERTVQGYQDGATKACEACGEPVPVDTEHIGAWVRVSSSTGPIFYRPVFCDAECWATWATSD